MTFNALVKENKLEIRGNIQEYLKKLEGKEVKVKIDKKRKIRSLNQNALYWLWLEQLSEYTGYETEEFHAMFKSMYLTDRSKDFPIIRSTTKLDKNQFLIYLDKIRKYCQENEILRNVALPDPNSEELI